MKRSTALCFVLLLLGLSLLWGCGYSLGSMINGKSDLPIPDTIVLRNNETGVIREFDSADEEFDRLYEMLNSRWGMYGEKKELCYYQMKYTFQNEKPPTCEAELRFPPGNIPDHYLPYPEKSSDDVIGVVMALDKDANKAAYILKDVEDYRDVTAIVYEPSDDTLEYALSLLNQ